MTYLPIFFRLLHWHWGNRMIAPVPVKQPWRIWIKSTNTNPQHNSIKIWTMCIILGIYSASYLILSLLSLPVPYNQYCWTRKEAGRYFPSFHFPPGARPTLTKSLELVLASNWKLRYVQLFLLSHLYLKVRNYFHFICIFGKSLLSL